MLNFKTNITGCQQYRLNLKKVDIKHLSLRKIVKMEFTSPSFKVGIMSGGQLGKMLCQAASEINVSTYVMDPSSQAPARNLCEKFVVGNQRDFQDVYNFGKNVDLLTFEIEHVNIDAIRKLKEEGVKVYPDPETLNTIKDKGLQKQFYADNNIPTSDFVLFESKQEVLDAIEKGEVQFPFVQKLRTDGYDGRGVAVISSESKIGLLMDAPCVVEDAVDIELELSVIVARNVTGQTKCFPIVEMEFNPDANLVEQLICPASVSSEIESKCQEIAIETANKIGLVGLLAVEIFLSKSGEILVNESAPRTHNSGHQTIEANVTSQYQQQIRAVLNLPLGETELVRPAVMLNLLGEPGYEGDAKYQGLEEVLGIAGVYPHIYGKQKTKPFRKMGHITITAKTIEEAKDKANKVKTTLKVIA